MLHLVLPSKVDPLVSLMKVEKVPDSTYGAPCPRARCGGPCFAKPPANGGARAYAPRRDSRGRAVASRAHLRRRRAQT